MHKQDDSIESINLWPRKSSAYMGLDNTSRRLGPPAQPWKLASCQPALIQQSYKVNIFFLKKF